LPRRRIGTRARVLGVAGAAGLVVAGWPAPAKGAPFELAWSAPEGCPSREEIVDATHASLGESSTEAPPEFFVQGAVRATDRGFLVTLVLNDAAGRAVGERVVRVDRQVCAEISTPASVVLAMMIAVARPRTAQRDEPRELAETPPASEHASPAPEHASPAPPAPHAPLAVRARTAMPSSPERLPPHRLSFGAAGVASVGALPGVGLGFGLHALYLPRSVLLLGLEASFEAGSSQRAGGGEVGFQLFSAAARVGLPVARTARFELIPTAGARVGLIRTVPIDFAAGQNDTRVIPSVGLGVLVRAKLRHSVFVEGLLDVELILLRDRFQVLEGDKLHRIHEPSAFGGRLSMGLAYDFR
jgi:hypothetical protein